MQGAAGLEAILGIYKSSFRSNEKCKLGTRTMLSKNRSVAQCQILSITRQRCLSLIQAKHILLL